MEIRKILTSKPGYIIFWMLLLIFLIYKTKSNFTSLLFSISTLLLFSHILYGGYKLFQRIDKINLIQLATTALIVVLIPTQLIMNVNNPSLWFISLGTIMFIALIYHTASKFTTTKEYIKEFCNYKLYIEIQALFFSIIGFSLITLLQSWTVLIAIINLLTILWLNWRIFLKKKLYEIRYTNPTRLKTPKVSIIVISYNEEKYIGRLLESIKSQNYKNYEVILVDDHSTDKTREIAKKYLKFFNLRIVQKAIPGQSRSRNYGAKLAKGSILVFLDADVILQKDFLIKNIKDFSENKLSSAFIDFTPITKSTLDVFYTKIYRTWLRLGQFYEPRGIGFCIIARKKAHSVTKFDEEVLLLEDFDYISRISKIGKFRILSSSPIKASWRRFEKENRFLLLMKYLYFESYRNLIGNIKKEIASYKYGHY